MQRPQLKLGTPLQNGAANHTTAAWYPLQTRYQCEKKVDAALRDRGIESFAPMQLVARRWSDRTKMVDSPLFPGYIFVHLPYAERVKVLSLPNVVDILGSKNAPSIVSAEEIDCIKRGVEFGNAVPHPALVEGQHVVIVSGVLRGMQGTLLRNQNNTRVVVTVNSIARSFAVDVDISCLKPAAEFVPLERKAV